MKLILVRHGETDHNRSNTHMGQLDVPLNERGREQARRDGKRLANEKIDVIYTSDLQRAMATAQEIAFHHNNQPEHDVRLRERHVGVLEGQPIHPDDHIGNTDKTTDRNKRPEGGESIYDVKIRAERWLNHIKKKHQKDTIVVVGHGLFLFLLLEVAIEDGADTERQDFILNNTSITILDFHPSGHANIVHLNDTSHLEDHPT